MVEVTYRAFESLSKRVSALEKEVPDMKTNIIQWVVSIGIAMILVVLGIVSVHTGMLIFAGE